jgi:hypothetical protein
VIGLVGGAAWYLWRGTAANTPRAPVILPLQLLRPDAAAPSPSRAVTLAPVAAPQKADSDAGAAGDADAPAIQAELERIANGEAARCRAPGDPAGTAYVTVKVEAPGRVKYAKVGVEPFADTPTAECIERRMLGARLPGFRGDELTLTQMVRLR